MRCMKRRENTNRIKKRHMICEQSPMLTIAHEVKLREAQAYYLILGISQYQNIWILFLSHYTKLIII